jgi:hypothetical protein
MSKPCDIVGIDAAGATTSNAAAACGPTDGKKWLEVRRPLALHFLGPPRSH